MGFVIPQPAAKLIIKEEKMKPKYVYPDTKPPREASPQQSMVIPKSAENLFWAQVRYFKDFASQTRGETSVAFSMKAVGMIEAYALLAGCTTEEARQRYHNNEHGGEGLYF